MEAESWEDTSGKGMYANEAEYDNTVQATGKLP
jgi:hypothetical protein